jgi:hypothetical protein
MRFVINAVREKPVQKKEGNVAFRNQAVSLFFE